MSAIYIGAGSDILPIKHLQNIKTFSYFDSQPFSEFGLLQSGYIMEDGTDGFYRPRFIENVDKEMKSINMILTRCIGDLRIYSDGNKIVKYYTNKSLPEHFLKIKSSIKDYDTLIVAGYHPDSIILEATNKKVHFIGIEGTFYGCDEYDNRNSIIYKMHKDNILDRFDKFTFINKNGNLSNFKSWSGFFDYYISK